MKKVLSVKDFSDYLRREKPVKFIYASANQDVVTDNTAFVHRFDDAMVSIAPNVVGFKNDYSAISFYDIERVEVEPVVAGKSLGTIIRLISGHNKKYTLVAS